MQHPIARDLVLVGGGHSHVVFLRMLGMQPIPGLQVTLVSPDIETPYSGMLPGLVAGHYAREDIHIDLVPLTRFAGARFVQGRVTDIDPYARRIEIEGHPALDYDVLSLNVGITPAMSVPGAGEHAIAVKPISTFLERWQAFLERARSVQQVSVVGGGAGGVELGLAIAYRLHQLGLKHVRLQLVFAEEELLPGYPEKVQAAMRRIVERVGINVLPEFKVREVMQTGLEAEDGRFTPADEVFWVTQAASQGWLRKTGLALDANGFVQVRDTLQASNFDEVFAVGDIAHMVNHPRPKAGVFAVRQGPVLFHNIRRYLHGRKPKPYKPQQEFLSLISAGNQYAVGSKYRFMVEGRWVWRWKNWIDKRFMKRFSRLPAMSQPKQTGLLKDFDTQMHCGGCGSKVAGDLLGEVLREAGLAVNQLDDAAVYRVPDGKVMLHSVDGFRTFVDDPYLFAQVAVQHALSDIYAMGGEPVTALAMITVPYAKPPRTRALLELVIAGVKAALDAEGVSLAGGHTTEGEVLSLGLAVNGTATEAELMTKAGLKVGQKLILTKPLGTGTLFAAHMQHRARGRDIAAALQHMLQSNRAAASLLREHGVRAATDVTGFGLAGHLLEMLRASNRSALLRLDQVPVLEGAMASLVNAGIKSTLHEGNQQAAREVRAGNHPRRPILFDPQTSGGLLAAVQPAEAEPLLAALKAAGYRQAAVIGEVTDAGEVSISLQ